MLASAAADEAVFVGKRARASLGADRHGLANGRGAAGNAPNGVSP